MKWLHWTIFRVLVSASALEMNGAGTSAKPATPAAAPTVFKKSRRVALHPNLFPPEDMFISLAGT
jgi:hypothetical protein